LDAFIDYNLGSKGKEKKQKEKLQIEHAGINENERRLERSDKRELTGRKDRNEDRTHNPERQQNIWFAVVDRRRGRETADLTPHATSGARSLWCEAMGRWRIRRDITQKKKERAGRRMCGGWGSDWARSAIRQNMCACCGIHLDFVERPQWQQQQRLCPRLMSCYVVTPIYLQTCKQSEKKVG
jgi:hypothetical protein